MIFVLGPAKRSVLSGESGSPLDVACPACQASSGDPCRIGGRRVRDVERGVDVLRVQAWRNGRGECACGCGAKLTRRNALTASGACRTRAWKARTGYAVKAVRKASQNGNAGRRRTPDMRISVRKLLAALEDEFGPATYARARARVLALLNDKQRRNLDA